MRIFTKHSPLLACLLCVMLPITALAGSWGQINQPLDRPEGWVQVITESPFALGIAKTVTAGEKSFAQIPYGTYPSIDGSTVAVPMALEFARQHLGMDEVDLPAFVSFSTTHHAYENLIQGQPNGAPTLITQNAVMDDSHPVDIIIATAPSDEELQLAENTGVTLIVTPVCYDAFVFITHVDNPVDSLTVQQIRDIYAGKITNWAEVSGEDDEIMPYQREKNSGSQTAMENLVMQGEPMIATGMNYFFLNEMSSLVARIGSYQNKPNSLGYTYKYYIDALYRDEGIKILAIDGIYPSDENLRDGSYPFTTHYNAVIRAGDEDETGGLFLQWMTSQEGQRCIKQAGYIPLMPLEGDAQ